MAKLQGRPCWYELMTGKGKLGAAEAFYREVLGWSCGDAGMEGFTYHLAQSDGDMVAGLMEPPPGAEGMPPFWMIYFAVEDADGAVSDIEAAGGKVHRAPADIPGTGRFAIVADPQGAGFGILAPAPMEGGGEGGRAFDQSKAGHGNWNELMTTDPQAAFGFYSGLFGWEKRQAIAMGAMGTYQVFAHDGLEIGGMMPMGEAPVPCWVPYFGVTGITEAMARVDAAGGRIAHGPIEVPGGAYIAAGQDPQGAWFALVGPKDAAAPAG